MECVDPAGKLERLRRKRQERAGAVERSENAQMEKRRQAMREQMPEIAGVVDAFRRAGVNVRVVYARENGKEVRAKGYRGTHGH